MAANKVRFTIIGSDYVVNTEDSEEFVLELAEKLEQDVMLFMQSSRGASQNTALIMTALTYLEELKKTNDGADNMRALVKEYLEDAARAKSAAENAHREVEHLRREVNFLRSRQGVPTQTVPDGQAF